MKNVPRCLLAFLIPFGGVVILGAFVFWYLRYEQRNETARYQLGYAQGIEAGKLEQQEEYRKQATCYAFSDPDEQAATRVAICGVAMLFDTDGHAWPLPTEGR